MNIKKKYYAVRNYIRDEIFYPIWYRIFGYKFHIVKTKLSPRPWIDTDERMLYAVMALVEWFVEKDMEIISTEDYKKEIERIKDNEYKHDKETMYQEIASWNHKYNYNCNIIKIYGWWKNYPNRQKEIRDAMSNWWNVTSDGRKRIFPRSSSEMTKEEAIEERRLSDHLRLLQDKLDAEEQEMLKLAIDMRGAMWS